MIRVMVAEGIIAEDDLERYRRRRAKADRERFQRHDQDR
jgi:hypothetical protein